MKKQAQYGSLIETFQAQLKLRKKAADVHSETQGWHESPISLGHSDSEVVAEIPTGGETNQKLLERGVETGSALPGADTHPPEEELVREQKSPEAKIAYIDELVARLNANLKTAKQEFTTTEPKTPEVKKAPNTQSEEKAKEPKADAAGTAGKTHEENLEKAASEPDVVVPVAEPVSETGEPLPKGKEHAKEEKAKDTVVSVAEPVTQTGKTAEINVDDLARKTAEFLQFSDLGYALAKELLNGDQQKIAGPDVEPEVEAAIAARVDYLKTAGLTDDQILDQLQKDGEADAMAAAEAAEPTLEELISYKVAALESQGATEEQICEILQKDAEADNAQLGHLIGQAITELEHAVQNGEMSEEQALHMLQQSGLDVNALIEAAQAQQGGAGGAVDPAAGAPQLGADPAAAAGGADPSAVAAPMAQVDPAAGAGAPPGLEDAAAAPGQDGPPAPKEKEKGEKNDGDSDSDDSDKSEKSEKSDKSDDKKDDKAKEKKEAADEGGPVDPSAGGGAPPEAAPAGPDAGAAPGPDAGGEPDLSQLPPEIQQVVQEIDALLQKGEITQEQAMAAIDALFSQGGGSPEPGGDAPGGAPGGAPSPAAPPQPGA